LSAADRLAIVQNQANQPITCEKCGSQWFSDVSFQQYSGSQYSSTPGGDLRVISALVHRIRVCICGHPVSPNVGGVYPGGPADRSGQLQVAELNLKNRQDQFRWGTLNLADPGK
jgi:hypothetical protein